MFFMIYLSLITHPANLCKMHCTFYHTFHPQCLLNISPSRHPPCIVVQLPLSLSSLHHHRIIASSLHRPRPRWCSSELRGPISIKNLKAYFIICMDICCFTLKALKPNKVKKKKQQMKVIR